MCDCTYDGVSLHQTNNKSKYVAHHHQSSNERERGKKQQHEEFQYIWRWWRHSIELEAGNFFQKAFHDIQIHWTDFERRWTECGEIHKFSNNIKENTIFCCVWHSSFIGNTKNSNNLSSHFYYWMSKYWLSQSDFGTLNSKKWMNATPIHTSCSIPKKKHWRCFKSRDRHL